MRQQTTVAQQSRIARLERGVRVPLTLPLTNSAGITTKVTFSLGAIYGGPCLLRVYLLDRNDSTHVISVEARNGRFAIPMPAPESPDSGIAVGRSARETARIRHAFSQSLQTPDGHDHFTNVVLSLDAEAINDDHVRSQPFRLGQALAWSTAHHAPTWVRDALADAALTWDGLVADLGQALLAASTPDTLSPPPPEPATCTSAT